MLEQKPTNRLAGEALIHTVVWNMHTTDLQIKPVRPTAVPVVDEHVLNVSFDRALENAVITTESGETKLVSSLPIYKNVERLIEAARSYFAVPPQLDFRKRSVKHRRIPVLSIDDDDKPWFYVTVECAPHLDAAMWEEAAA
ncbi:hypothetical protein [Burkholderia vietnamiensis]|uniref:hypothetical protein n=1 Tax=Burkholderia vietnamiensis TaxID=60552 RepID=UPI001B955B2B|nr:hypothetical protein [Burkholderia vietnamiensis]MBR8218242.1 hypothetical protein [Burkholderia vietnamiensis]